MKTFWNERFYYLGPLRDDPKVIFAAPTDVDRRNVGTKGEFTAAVLTEYGESIIECPLPPNLRHSKDSLPIHKGSLTEAVTLWLEYMGLVESVFAQERSKVGYELTIRPLGLNKKLDLTNVGVGVSQVLPTLVMSLLAPKDSLLVFEQPELHLHPKVQSILGDFFLSIVAMGKQCIIETHSERIIHRVRRRIAEAPGDEIMRLAQIYFVERTGAESHVIKVEPNEYGNILAWPKGFFDEGPEEADLIIQAATLKRLAKQKRASKQ